MIVGVSPAIRRAVALADRFAATPLPVILVGPTGTGKELFAAHIHAASKRHGPFVDVNCGALPRDMAESLLFGHRRGAFTGAVASTTGYVRRSDGGTLFLDELQSLPADGQVKLLRVLETSEVQPLGTDSKYRVDVRVVVAVQDDIAVDLDAGRFRRDLYHRVAGVVIELPKLIARIEDVVPLAVHFAALQGQVLGPDAEGVLLQHAWPGNVRELRLVIARAAGLVDNGRLPGSALAEAIALGTPAWHGTGSPSAPGFSRAELLSILQDAGWNVHRAADAAGIGRTTLFKRLRAAGISLREIRKFTSSQSIADGGERGERRARPNDPSGCVTIDSPERHLARGMPRRRRPPS